ncbi:dihydrofolate reductase family protein [Rhodococcus coprophilus]|uniref:RibD C-terminal domain n=1 Tax=Rhodococcus coprophilus TaxID=38310 RepID=A0A2X4UHG8_9NOCA|nr:hypothetical protein [Rhodococcus coprophilus]MBM7458898.1 dihydrofolate reductase [Rhodococcus coprophilus]SQI33982.1 RibD C-terminal domain [Rhodococcus coprophilus]
MGKVAWGFTCSIDGFIAGPGHDMSWLSASEPLAEGTTERMAGDVAVIISGRAEYDAGDRDVQIISADIARQALEHDLIDELQVFVAPGGRRLDWDLIDIYEDSPRSFGRTYRPKGHRVARSEQQSGKSG